MDHLPAHPSQTVVDLIVVVGVVVALLCGNDKADRRLRPYAVSKLVEIGVQQPVLHGGRWMQREFYREWLYEGTLDGRAITGRVACDDQEKPICFEQH
jgi:hypothetical protein